MYPPFTRKLKRGPQVVLPKDAGAIIAYAGIGRDTKVLDAGAGSGWLAVQLGRVAGQVVSYEVREDFLKLAGENVKRAGLADVVDVRGRDILKDGFDEKEADVVCLDFANSDQAVPAAAAALKDGGVLVGYLPHAEQLKAFVLAGQASGLGAWYCCEMNVREMLVRPQGVRPANVSLSHTGYLAFGTKGAPNESEEDRKKRRR
ncbi:MAG: methyltransferase domain-containing protein [Candidatus Micrarchaeota archaeon]|nr:methyltransferase domain-containing protein [Candidatus Micrarchaeota archaeon]